MRAGVAMIPESRKEQGLLLGRPVKENVSLSTATLIIAAAGTMVLIGGGIDLSVGATYALCQVIAMKMAISGTNPVLAILAGVIIGIGVGAANGVITKFFRINSLIATLATSFVITGAAALITGGNLITNFAVTGTPPGCCPPRRRTAARR
jgi:ribose/xylose/arabinose/galactoside ABC-type transport system permease subunit